MNLGIELTGMLSRVCCILLAAGALGACQPTLNSDLPSGSAAYGSIGDAVLAPEGLYRLRPGDTIAVNIFQEEELSQRQLQIDEAGTISLPLIGDIQAGGLSSGQLSRVIESAYGSRFLRNPQANVVLLSSRASTVAVEGQVRSAGVYEIQPGYTLLAAVARAGSPTPEAKLDEVLVFRMANGERLGGRFDLTDIRAGRSPDPQILPGDVVVVGISPVRSIYRDFLQAAPLLGVFTRF